MKLCILVKFFMLITKPGSILEKNSPVFSLFGFIQTTLGQMPGKSNKMQSAYNTASFPMLKKTNEILYNLYASIKLKCDFFLIHLAFFGHFEWERRS